MDWTNVESPSLDDLHVLAVAAFEGLPPRFRALAGDIVFVVQDLPDEDVVEEMELESEFDILGLFQGPDLAARRGASASGGAPTMIFLYRRPLLDYWAEHEETLGHLVRHVIIHEIGHHFGLSDDAMHAIEDED